MIEIHERVVLSRYISISGFAAAESCPWLELIFEPIGFASAERNGIEYVDRLDGSRRIVFLATLDQGMGEVDQVAELLKS